MSTKVSLLSLAVLAGVAMGPQKAEAEPRDHRGSYHNRSDYHGGRHRDYYRDHHRDYRSPYNHSRSWFSFSAPVYTAPPPVIVERPVYRSRPVYQGRSVVADRSSSLEVDLQLALRRQGYYRGPIDGDVGPGTRAAIRAYQRDFGMRETGTITNSLLERLGL